MIVYKTRILDLKLLYSLLASDRNDERKRSVSELYSWSRDGCLGNQQNCLCRIKARLSSDSAMTKEKKKDEGLATNHCIGEKLPTKVRRDQYDLRIVQLCTCLLSQDSEFYYDFTNVTYPSL